MKKLRYLKSYYHDNIIELIFMYKDIINKKMLIYSI